MAENVTSAKREFPKKLGIAIIILCAGIIAAIILLHHNPLADPQ